MKINKELQEKIEQANKRIEEKEDTKHVPAYRDARDNNLIDRCYCWFCEMPWYNCLCSHEED